MANYKNIKQMKHTYLFILLLSILYSCNNSHDLADAYGNFEAKETCISSHVNGDILEFNINEGDKIKKGKIVAIIDSTTIVLEKKTLSSQLGIINSKINGINKNIEVQNQQKDNLKVEKLRLNKLFKEGAATRKQMDDLLAQERLLDKQMEATRSQITITMNEKKSVYTQIERLNNIIDKYKIINPVNGTVLETYIENNELAITGAKLYKIANLDKLTLHAYISGAQLSEIKTGDTVNVYIDKNKKENYEYSGIVTWIASEAEFTPKIIQTKEERVDLVYAIKVRVKNDGKIKIGMPGEVFF